MKTRNLVLAGDSIFDNDIYVPGDPSVIEQLNASLPDGWTGTKVAVDGDCTRDVPLQFERIPSNATDLIISVGGNDALESSHLLKLVSSEDDLEAVIETPLERFKTQYQGMLRRAKDTGLRLFVCSIYTAIPFEEPHWQTWAPKALKMYNAIIRNLAEESQLTLIDIDAVCIEESDYSVVSAIEPSSSGGQKIVDSMVAYVCR